MMLCENCGEETCSVHMTEKHEKWCGDCYVPEYRTDARKKLEHIFIGQEEFLKLAN